MSHHRLQSSSSRRVVGIPSANLQQGLITSSSRRYTSQGRHQSNMTKGGGVRYCRSYGAESFENVASVRSKRSSTGTNGTKISLRNHQARRPRAAHRRGIAAKDATSESDENEEERVEWGTRKYEVRMSPAHPRYVGLGDDTYGGEVLYTIQEIRTLLRSQPEDANRLLTTGQMG
jgi:hypothetical protein